MADKKPVVLGQISGVFGVKGWMKLHSFTVPREAILDYSDWQLECGGDWQSIEVAEGKRHGKTVIARFAGIEDRDAAARYVNCVIGVRRESLPATSDDEYYWSDLEGLRVVHRDGSVLGNVAYLLETGANDVLVVRSKDQEHLIPYLKEDVIDSVDLEEGVINVNWEWIERIVSQTLRIL